MAMKKRSKAIKKSTKKLSAKVTKKALFKKPSKKAFKASPKKPVSAGVKSFRGVAPKAPSKVGKYPYGTIQAWAMTTPDIPEYFNNYTASQSEFQEKYQIAFLRWLEESTLMEKQVMLGMIFENQYPLSHFQSLSVSGLHLSVGNVINRLSLADTAHFQLVSDEVLALFSIIFVNPCKLFDICKYIDVTNGLVRINDAILKFINENLQPLDGIVKGIYENKGILTFTWLDVESLRTLMNNAPAAFLILILTILLIKGLWDKCKCKREKEAVA